MAQVSPSEEGLGFQSTYPSRGGRDSLHYRAEHTIRTAARAPASRCGNGDEHLGSGTGGFHIHGDRLVPTAPSNVDERERSIANTGPSITNAYTLQIKRTNPEHRPVAELRSNDVPSLGTVHIRKRRFLRASHHSVLAISYNNPCPAGGWNSFPYPGRRTFCYRNKRRHMAFLTNRLLAPTCPS